MATEREKPFGLDMDFSEALERFAQVDPKEVGESADTAEAEPAQLTAAPFIKWAGGKRYLLPELTERLPSDIGQYFEPFVGSGALFFATHELTDDAHLSDIILDLVITYNVIKKDPEPLMELLAQHAEKNSEEYYYRTRKQHSLKNPIQVAARFIYLNKTCYNGLYRLNKKGEFNVPFGKYASPAILRPEQLQAAHRALQKASIEYREFDSIKPKAGDFVYFDPPYDPVSPTASFTGYSKLNFTQDDQRRLRDFVLKLHRDGVNVMVSNSDTEFIKGLYSNRAFKIDTVQAPRMINSKPTKRGAVNELIITNY